MNKFPRINLEKTGANLTKMMREKGVSVKAMQENLGLTNPQAIYKWRRGECLPTLDNLVAIALLLDTTIDKIIVVDA